MDKLGLTPQDCIIVEDTVNGVLAGKAAGVRVIGVKGNKAKRKKLKDAGADFVYQDLNIPLSQFS